MADTHGDMDIRQHRQTYGGVMSLMKWGTAISAVLAAVVVLLIAG